MSARWQTNLWMLAAASMLLIGTGVPADADTKVSCGRVVAAMESGNASADEVAAQLGVSVKRVRKCMSPTAAKGAAAGKSGCGKIVAAMESGNASPDEVAAKLGVRVKRVRRCMETAAAQP